MTTLPKHWEELTLMSTPTSIVEEFVKKYKNCYIWFLIKEKEPILVKVETISNNTLSVSSQKYGILQCKIDSKEIKLLVNFPKRGAFSSNKDYLIFNRIPARQYKKAPNQENSSIYNPFVRIQHRIILQNLEENIEYAYEKKHIPFYTGCNEIKEKSRNGFSLTKDFGITNHIDESNKLLLWYLSHPIGSIENNRLFLKAHCLEQEIIDLIRKERLDLQYEII